MHVIAMTKKNYYTMEISCDIITQPLTSHIIRRKHGSKKSKKSSKMSSKD